MTKCKNKDSFCVLPWIHSFINVGGEFQVCCSSEEFDNDISTKDGKKLNIKDGVTSQTAMNAESMKKLRMKMLKGEWDPICERCHLIERHGGMSRRHLENGAYQNRIDSLIELTNDDGTIEPHILSADYRLGNICNLQCRMCNPRSSKLWLKDWNKIKFLDEQFSEPQLQEFKNYNWYDEDVVLKDFFEKAETIEHLHFAGGEPLIVPRMYTMLKKCIELGRAKEIELTYNTNISVLPPKVLELWPYFKGVHLLCSIDAYGKLNDFIRPPSRWEIIDRNLKYLDQNADHLGISSILLSTTVQASNVLSLDKLCHYLDENFQKVRKMPNLVNLRHPFYMRTQILPHKIKNKAKQKLEKIKEEFKNKVPPQDQYLVQNIDQIIGFMFEEDLSHFYQRFHDFNQDFDELKPESVQSNDVIPELEPMPTLSKKLRLMINSKFETWL